MRSCAKLSAPCSCLTVVAAEATWTEVGAGAATGGDGPHVAAVPAPGSVLTVAAERSSLVLGNVCYNPDSFCDWG